MSGFESILAWWRRRARPLDPAEGLNLNETDVAELTAIEHRLEREYRATAPAVISLNLARLRNRRVPVRAVRAAEVRGMAQLCFADGTVVFVRSQRPGDLGVLVVRSAMQPILFEAFHTEPRGVVIDLAWRGDRVSVVAVGLDEAV